MDHLDMCKVSLLLVPGLLSTLAASRADTRWIYICVSTTVTVACPERHLFNITDVSAAYKAEFCPTNLTDPVDSVADCYESFSAKKNFVSNTRFRCNGSRICDLGFDPTVLQTCATSSTANFLAVSYTCYNESIMLICTIVPVANFLAVRYTCYSDPNPPTTTQSKTTAKSTVPASSQSTTAASSTEPLPYIIPIAVVAVAVLMGLILLVPIIIYRKRRNRRGKSVERLGAQEESVTYCNVQIDNSPIPPVLSDSDLSTNIPAISTESEEPQPTSDYEGISSQNEMPFREHNYEKISVSNETSAYTGMAFTPDYVNAEGY